MGKQLDVALVSLHLLTERWRGSEGTDPGRSESAARAGGNSLTTATRKSGVGLDEGVDQGHDGIGRIFGDVVVCPGDHSGGA